MMYTTKTNKTTHRHTTHTDRHTLKNRSLGCTHAHTEKHHTHRDTKKHIIHTEKYITQPDTH